MLNAATIAGLAIQGLELASQLVAGAAAVKDALSTTDEAALKEKLAALQKQNDELFASVDGKLTQAGGQ